MSASVTDRHAGGTATARAPWATQEPEEPMPMHVSWLSSHHPGLLSPAEGPGPPEVMNLSIRSGETDHSHRRLSEGLLRGQEQRTYSMEQ